jgi:hypothetical protein
VWLSSAFDPVGGVQNPARLDRRDERLQRWRKHGSSRTETIAHHPDKGDVHNLRRAARLGVVIEYGGSGKRPEVHPYPGTRLILNNAKGRYDGHSGRHSDA